MNNVIVTSTGKEFDPINPDPDLIDIQDIAAGLSRICRFAGQLRPEKEFYSVAQHSVLATHWALLDGSDAFLGVPPSTGRDLLSILLHDASEAYLSDIPSPVKLALPDYKAIEYRLQSAIYKKFLGTLPDEGFIKLYDRRMLQVEIQELMSPSPAFDPWVNQEQPPINIPESIQSDVQNSWLAGQARRICLSLYWDLSEGNHSD